MYAEFGATSTDSITMTLTYGSSGLTTAKTFNILTRQISCTATYKAPTDCTQYFTGVAGTVHGYSYGQFLQAQYYTNCIRTEKGYCSIQWKQSSTTSPDPFGILGTTTTAAGAGGSSTTRCSSGSSRLAVLRLWHCLRRGGTDYIRSSDFPQTTLHTWSLHGHHHSPAGHRVQPGLYSAPVLNWTEKLGCDLVPTSEK